MGEGRRRHLMVLGSVLGALGLSCGSVRGCGDHRKVIHVAAADSLATAFAQMAETFERENPDVAVKATFEGSVLLLRKQLLHPSDVVALADHRLIEEVLRPDDADWLAQFATTEIVIARTQASRHAEEITPENWAEVLLRPGVTVAHPDPATDSCGYYTRLSWKTAERRGGARRSGLFGQLAAKASPQYQRPDALSVLALLESRAVDYAFVYRCLAEQHHLPYTLLPEGTGLGDPAMEREYAASEVEVPDFRGNTVAMKGHPIYFGLTISRHSRQRAPAERFVHFILSHAGQQILRRAHVVPIAPAIAPPWSTGIPESLKGVIELALQSGRGG